MTSVLSIGDINYFLDGIFILRLSFTNILVPAEQAPVITR